ncbi:MAG: prolipoprotein diacylglyceryl transferase [Luteolibacter sp.]
MRNFSPFFFTPENGPKSLTTFSDASPLAGRAEIVCLSRVLAIYVHHLNPIAVPIYHGHDIRWYGLAYLSGFIGGFLLLRYLAQRGLWVLKPEKTADFIAAAALFGVFLGGRLGYILFYHIPKVGWAGLMKDPLVVFRVWEGGMASHGGILGLVIFTWFYARKEKVSWTGLGDGLCVVAPLGLMFGRAANFVNGELYGRVANGVSWAMKFPLSIGEEPPEVQNAAWQACTQVDPKLADAQSLDALITASRENPAVRNALAEFLQPRHPSQIYEGLLEGALLFTILWVVRIRFKNAPHGLLTGLFFALYAIFRIFGEQFREPDAAMVGFLTKGQFFSLFMFIFAACFLTYAWRGRKLVKNS